MHKLKMQVFVY